LGGGFLDGVGGTEVGVEVEDIRRDCPHPSLSASCS
jgi:hypothetical protein